MDSLFGIAAIIIAIAVLVRDWHIGRACLIWARRCDPRNPSFRPPNLPGRRTRD